LRFYVTPFQGLIRNPNTTPRALPWAGMSDPFGVMGYRFEGTLKNTVFVNSTSE